MPISLIMGIVRLAEYIFLSFAFAFWSGATRSTSEVTNTVNRRVSIGLALFYGSSSFALLYNIVTGLPFVNNPQAVVLTIGGAILLAVVVRELIKGFKEHKNGQ